MPTVLAALFGSILALLLAALAVYLVLTRVSHSQRARERRFRYGAASTTPGPHSLRRTSLGRGSTSVLAMVQSNHARASEAASAVSHESDTRARYMHVPPMSPPPESTASTEAAVGATASPVRTFLNTSPILFKKHKGDADSLRTDFLQV